MRTKQAEKAIASEIKGNKICGYKRKICRVEVEIDVAMGADLQAEE